MLEGRKLINVESFLALIFSVFYCFLEMPLNADEYEAICNSRECLVKVNEDLISTPFASIKSSRMTSWPLVVETQPRMLGFLGEKDKYTFNLNGYDQEGRKKSLNIQFINDKSAKKFIREIETVSGLGLGQRRSAKQIRENELLDKTKNRNLKE